MKTSFTSSITATVLLWHCLFGVNLATAQAVGNTAQPKPCTSICNLSVPMPIITNGTTPQIGTTPSVTSGGTGSGKDTLPIGSMTTGTSASTKDSVAIQLEKDAIARQQTSDQDQRIQGKVIAKSNQAIDDKRVNTQGIGIVTHIEVSPSGITTLGSATK